MKTELGQPIFDSVYGNKREIRYLSEGFFLFDCNVYIFNIENDIVYSAECKFVGIWSSLQVLQKPGIRHPKGGVRISARRLWWGHRKSL